MTRRALVTGGAGAIGAAICKRLAASGHEVIVHANRHPEKANALCEEIRAAGGKASVVAFDVADGKAVRAALEPIVDASPIQVLVNNAGIHADAPFVGMSDEQWKGVIDVSLNGFYHVTRALALPMARTRWGRIVTITSIAAQLGNRGQANYAAAKGALHAASRTLAIELGTRGVTVNCVAPGIIASPMSDAAFDEARIRELVLLRRAGKPEEVAAVVAFLASDAAGYITGQVLNVNGGMS